MSLPKLLLLPGTLCDASLFAHQMEHLRDIAAVQVVDVHHQDTLSDVARYVLERVEGQFTVAGLSYGGIVAFELWRQQPARVLKLALLHTNPYEASPQTRANFQRFVEMSYQGEFREVTTNYLKDRMLHPDHRNNMALRKIVLKMAENIGMDGFVNQVKAQLGRPSAIPDLPHIDCPTLVLTGREDGMTPVSLHQMMADHLPNSRLVIIEHCGHLSTIEQPESTTQALREWLTDTGIWKSA